MLFVGGMLLRSAISGQRSWMYGPDSRAPSCGRRYGPFLIQQLAAQYPDDPQTSKFCVPMMKEMTFDPKFRPALAQVFRKCLVVKDLEIGSRFSRSHNLHCVTIQGDQVNDKGAISGGYLDIRNNEFVELRSVAQV